MAKPVNSKDKLINLLERNPPELFTALSCVITDMDFNKKAEKAASDLDALISKIKAMDIYEINKLYTSVQGYLK